MSFFSKFQKSLPSFNLLVKLDFQNFSFSVLLVWFLFCYSNFLLNSAFMSWFFSYFIQPHEFLWSSLVHLFIASLKPWHFLLESLSCPSAKMLSLGESYDSDVVFWKRWVVLIVRICDFVLRFMHWESWTLWCFLI